MSDKRTFILSHEIARRGAMRAVADAPAGYVIEIKPRTRSLEQNAAQWPTSTHSAGSCCGR